MVSVYPCLDRSLSPKWTKTVDELLQYIKNPTHKADILLARQSGKKNVELIYTDKIWKSFSKTKKQETGKSGEYVDVSRNIYNHVKSSVIPSVTWAGTFSLRNKSGLIDLNGYIFFDIDDFSEISVEQALNILKDSNFKFVKAVWKSFGGNGLGFLVKFEGLTVLNFESTWNYAKDQFSKYGLKIDVATKDFTRLSVLSYDEDIFIRPDEEIIPLYAKEETYHQTSKLSFQKMKDNQLGEIEEIYCQHIFSNLFEDGSNWNVEDNRLSYVFYQRYFSMCNLYGITLDSAINHIKKISEINKYIFSYRDLNEVNDIGQRQYDHYSEQFGSLIVENAMNFDSNYNVLQYNIPKAKDKIQHTLEYHYNTFIFNSNKTAVKKYYAYFIRMKREGLLPTTVKDFISNKNEEITQEIIDLLYQVYSNVQFQFGLVVEEKESSILTRREKFIESATKRGLQVVELSENNTEYNNLTFIQKTYKQLVASGDTLTEKTLYYFIKELLNYNVSKQNILTFCDTDNNLIKLKGKIDFFVDEIYKYFQFQKGIKTTKKFSNVERNNLYDFKTKIFLPNDQKLSYLDLDLEDWTILWANTNMGKTTYICNDLSSKRIVLVPVIGALQSIEQKFGASVFFEHKKNVTKEDNLIVCTYSSFPKLLNLIKSWGNIAEYELYVDEMHNLAVSSNLNFRNKEMNYILDNIHLFKKRVMLTGTLYPIVHPVLSSFSVIRIDWEKPIVKPYYEVYYENLFISIEKRLIKGKKNIIYFQNKQHEGEMGKFLLFLKEKGWENIQYINADEKYSDHFKRLIELERIDDNVEVLLCTSVMVEALNVLNEDVETIHFMTFENPILLEQMVNRCRIKLPEQIFVYKKMKETDEISDDIDIVEIQKKLIEDSENLLKIFTPYPLKNISNENNKLLNKIRRDQLFQNNALIRKISDSYHVDYLSISNISLEEETLYAYKNSEYLQEILSEYSWKLIKIVVDSQKMEESLKVALKEFKEENQEKLKVKLITICDEIVKEGEDVLKETIVNEDLKKYDKLERGEKQVMLRLKTYSLLKYMTFDSAINLLKLWITEYNSSEKSWNRIKRQIHLKSGVINGIISPETQQQNINKSAVYKLYEKYKDHTFYEFELIKLFNKTLEKYEIEFSNIDELSEFMLEYFEINATFSSNGKIKYKFGGLNPLRDISAQYGKIIHFVTNAINEQKHYSVDELYTLILKFRRELPYLKNITLKKKDVLTLLRDHVEVQSSSSRKEGSKRIYTYKFISTVPKDIENIDFIETFEKEQPKDDFIKAWKPIFF